MSITTFECGNETPIKHKQGDMNKQQCKLYNAPRTTHPLNMADVEPTTKEKTAIQPVYNFSKLQTTHLNAAMKRQSKTNKQDMHT